MRNMYQMMACALLFGGMSACEMPDTTEDMAVIVDGDYERGPNNGRMLRDGNFAVELAIFEAGLPPEFRAWVTQDGDSVNAGAVELTVTLERLGGRDEIAFESEGTYLRGDQVVYEPHSFAVLIDALYQGNRYQWNYESFEGRTRIAAEMADSFGITTDIAGPATLEESILVYGTVVPDPARVREVSARFNGVIQAVDVALGEVVEQGQRLATVESNESLQSYAINAPIAGIIMDRAANAGEQTSGRQLFTIVDTSTVWAELAIFPGDRSRIAVGQEVQIAAATGGDAVGGSIALISPIALANQSVAARVVLDNSAGRWAPGTYVTAAIEVAVFDVPLAVRRSGLQSFRDFTVVYAQFGDQYEVRMLDLGRQDELWVEVLGGLEPGTRYVTTNSYVLKADVEKSGATHDH